MLKIETLLGGRKRPADRNVASLGTLAEEESRLVTRVFDEAPVGHHQGRRRRRISTSTSFSHSRMIIGLASLLLFTIFQKEQASAFVPSPTRSPFHVLAPACRWRLPFATNVEFRRMRRNRAHPNGNTNESGSPVNLPRHVAFVCDGNSRWAAAHNLPSSAGHIAGADRLIHVLDGLRDRRVQYCTMYGFSTENWKRPAHEVRDILNVMETTARRFYNRALEENVCVRLLGDLDDKRLPKGLTTLLRKLEQDTARKDGEDKFTLCVALNYGGRQDILNASRRLVEAVDDANTEFTIADIDEDAFCSFLSTVGIPDPDLIVRTSGESRLSNFLLWNAAYAELYFTTVLWPDFDETALDDALEWYAQRKRRFGARIVEASPTIK
jgi:undecaprenyl diphosphate synthase